LGQGRFTVVWRGSRDMGSERPQRRRLMRSLGTAFALLSLVACGESPSSSHTTAEHDAHDAHDAVSLDSEIGEAEVVTGPAERVWAHRAIGGISMGAASVNIALASEEHFDMAAGLGGYMDLRYMMTASHRLQLAGFCPLEQLEANLEDLNDPDAPGLQGCGPMKAIEELEFAQDFNHLKYDENGASFDRGFYMDVFKALTMATGNFTSEPSGDSPYIPAGIDVDWFMSTPDHERCENPQPAAQEHSYNLEYNPEGIYPVILFCDGDNKSEGWPDGVFDPSQSNNRPSDIVLAVDLNGNGKRDFHEPLVLNGVERFEDVGSDGCGDGFEDGEGGCDESVQEPLSDRNGDNYHWLDRPQGTELNSWWDEGEPYTDHGLDGVPGTGDTGESNGAYDRASSFDVAYETGAVGRVHRASTERLERMDFYFDSGIRDPLHAPVSTRHVAGAIHDRVGGLSVYRGFYEQENALFPQETASSITTQILFQDMSEEALGKHVYVEYGNADATEAQIAKGDGKHVGTTEQVLARILAYIIWAAQRFPDPDLDDAPWDGSALSSVRHFYSEGLQSRRRFSIALPPGYHDPEKADRHYPVIYLLHGKGQSAADFGAAGILTSSLMEDGALPKAIVVFPDGRCCRHHVETGQRYCACWDSEDDGMKRCVDPTCEGDEESCEEVEISRDLLPEECSGGSLFFNLVTNRWGQARDDLQYETSIVELVGHVDANWRTREPSTEP
jgi:hypothetical protein